MIRELFEDRLLVDDREPILSLELFGYTLHLLLPKVVFYQQALVISAVQIIMTCILAFITYHTVVKVNNKKRELRAKMTASSKDDSSISSKRLVLWTVAQHCFCYFIIFPFCWWFPFRMIDYLDIRNGASRLACTFIPLNYPFRCIEALHDFTPKAATTSAQAFMKHAGFNMIPLYDKKNNGQMVQVTWYSLYQCFLNYLYGLTIICLMYSICLPMIDTPTTSTTDAATTSYDALDFSSSLNGTNWKYNDHQKGNPLFSDIYISFDLNQWKQSYILALLVNLSMFYGFHGYGMLAIPLGGVVYNMKLTDWPMLKSTSPSDFWGRKWNNLVHYALKQGIYKPVRSLTKNKMFATVSAFIVSGILHEYLWLILFYKSTQQLQELKQLHSNDGRMYTPGKQMLFFGWNAIVIMFEFTIGQHIAKQILRFITSYTDARKKKNDDLHSGDKHDTTITMDTFIPRPVLATLIIMTSLPIGHLFTDDFLHSGYYRTMQTGIPLITVEYA